METNKRAVLAPIVYSSLFAFPLTLREVVYFTQGKRSYSETECRRALATLYPCIQEKKGYYFLNGAERSVSKRIRGESYRQEKERVIEKTIRLLRFVPTVYFIGLSGALAAGSIKKNDDIDLFIITKKNSVFLTRFFLLFILQLVGKRRTREQKTTAGDTFCLNMFMDERHLSFSRDLRDIYLAREITQMVPLYDKKDTYSRFMQRNAWVSHVLPNATKQIPHIRKKKLTKAEVIFEHIFSISFVESVMRRIQLFRMQSHRTTEIILPEMLAFHPNNSHTKTIKLYHSKMKQIEANFTGKKRKNMVRFPVIDKEKNIFYTA